MHTSNPIGRGPHIHMTPEKLKQFKKLYEWAVQMGDKMFLFEDRGFLVSYARYLVEYLEGEFAQRGM